MIAKVAGGVIFIGLLGTGSVALAKPGLLGMMPNCTKLSEDHDYSDGDNGKYKEKFGASHKDQLVGVFGKKSGEDGNKEWWEWSFERLKKGNVSSGAFQPNTKVNSAYSSTSAESTSSPKALNRVCEDAYKAEPSKIKNPGTGDNEFSEEHVWKYCSWLGQKPIVQQQ